jgi:hypothetical protein
VDVTTARLNKISELFDARKLVPHVGSMLPLEKACIAHEMLGGASHKRRNRAEHRSLQVEILTFG